MSDHARLILSLVVLFLAYAGFAYLIYRGPRQKRSPVIHRFQDRSAELHFLQGQTVSEAKKKAWR